MWRAEAGLKDGADVGMAPRVCKALEAGGWEAQVGQRLERLAGSEAWQEAGLRWRQEGERCSRSQSQLGEGRKEAQSPLPGFQPG